MSFYIPEPDERNLFLEAKEREDSLCKITVFHTGPRPKTLGKCYYKNDPLFVEIKFHTKKQQRELYKQGKRRFVCGGANGFDTIAFFAALELKEEFPDIEIILALPSKTYHSKWYDQQVLAIYAEMIETADQVVFVDSLEKYAFKMDGMSEYQIATIKNYNRNQFMVDSGYTCLGLWDGKDGGTADCIKRANKFGRTIITITPGSYHVDVRFGMYG